MIQWFHPRTWLGNPLHYMGAFTTRKSIGTEASSPWGIYLRGHVWLPEGAAVSMITKYSKLPIGPVFIWGYELMNYGSLFLFIHMYWWYLWTMTCGCVFFISFYDVWSPILSDAYTYTNKLHKSYLYFTYCIVLIYSISMTYIYNYRYVMIHIHIYMFRYIR
jgi:hypothetical protein